MSIPKRAEPEAFFQELEDCFQTAYGETGKVEQSYKIAGFNILLQFAGEALLPVITPALSHLRIPSDSKPDLTLFLWDTESTGREIPPPPWDPDDYTNRGDIPLPEFNDRRFRTAFQLGENTLSFLDLESNKGLFWTSDARKLPYWVTGAPLRSLLNWWFDGRGLQLIHGAAVGVDGTGVILTARGGSGKSTTALACLLEGMNYVGDDYLVLGMEPVPTVYSMYSSGKLDAKSMARFPQLQSVISNAEFLDREKALLFLNEKFAENIKSQVSVKSVLIPKITGEAATRFRKASAMEALVALAPTTISQLPLAKQNALKALKSFVQSVPCHHLELGTDFSRIPEAISRFIKDG